jgi:hypothetical protein
MIRHLWQWTWEDLGIEPPTRRQVAVGLVYAILIGLVVWLLVSLMLLVPDPLR